MDDNVTEVNNKLTEIEELASVSPDENPNRLLELSYDDDEEVRYSAIEALENFSVTDEMIHRVRSGLSDSNEIVRTSCIELIGDWEDVDSVESLYACLDDSSELVRGAAITSLSQIGREGSADFLMKRHPLLTVDIEKASSTIALYMLGKEEYLDEALSIFDKPGDYRARCRTANLIARYLDKKDKKYVILRLKKALLKEEDVDVSSSISNAIRELESS